jgi:hypothetical protein
MSRSGVKSRLTAHDKSKKKRGNWSHFSVYSVWPNISDAEIEELEGLFRANSEPYIVETQPPTASQYTNDTQNSGMSGMTNSAGPSLWRDPMTDISV